jgi:hypothetical protein
MSPRKLHTVVHFHTRSGGRWTADSGREDCRKGDMFRQKKPPFLFTISQGVRHFAGISALLCAAAWCVVVTHNTGYGLHTEDNMMTVARCHSALRTSGVAAGDLVLAVSCSPGSGCPRSYRAAVRHLDGKRMLVAVFVVAQLVWFADYHGDRSPGSGRGEELVENCERRSPASPG